MIFDLNAVVSNFAVKVAHNLIVSSFQCFFFCVVYVYNYCPQMNQIHHSRMGMTSHLSDACDAFSSFYFYLFLDAESDDDNKSDESDNYGSGSEFTFGP